MTTWVMIPARGGSVGVPRKNVRKLKDKPLIAWSIETALSQVAADHVIVMTDDDEIAGVAQSYGTRVLREERTTGKQTLDDVARKVITELMAEGAETSDVFVTVQPTCPFIKGDRIQEAVMRLKAGAGAVLTVTDDRHLNWTITDDGIAQPLYTARVNRQLLPPSLRETGGVIATTIGNFLAHDTRIVQPIELVEVEPDEALDIDTFNDWVVADYLANRLSISIRVDAATHLGMGHVYRALALAQELASHRIAIIVSESEQLSRDFFAQHPFPVIEVASDAEFINVVSSHDIVILDRLDTSAELVNQLKNVVRSVVTFEDLGTGAEIADLVVSDLYKNPRVPPQKQLNGIRSAILSPAFNEHIQPIEFSQTVETILVIFGGTDPAGLTDKTLQALASINFAGEVLVVRGMGAADVPELSTFGLRGEVLHNVKHMPSVMGRTDLAISSAGRTITELLSLGIPTICMAQNAKELTHTHASAEFGVLNLGLGKLCTIETIAAHIDHLMTNTELRKTLHERAVYETQGRSNSQVIKEILTTLEQS